MPLTLQTLINNGLLDELANCFPIDYPDTYIILTAIGFQMSKSTVPSGSSHGIETSNFKHFGSLPRGSINTFLFLCLIGSVSFIVIDSMILHEIMQN